MSIFFIVQFSGILSNYSLVLNKITLSEFIFSREMILMEMHTEKQKQTLRGLINTPFKKAMFVVQIISYVLIVGSPLIGGAIGGLLGMKAAKIGGLVLGILLTGKVLFYSSLAFLGKDVYRLIRDRLKLWFKKRGRKSKQA